MNEIKIIFTPHAEEILMRDMPQGSIGRIISDPYHNTIVRRTCSETFVVENLSDPGNNCCWTSLDVLGLRVSLTPNAKIIIDMC
jgi:hypothetical protein